MKIRTFFVSSVLLLSTSLNALPATWETLSPPTRSFYGIAANSREVVAVGIDGVIARLDRPTGSWTITADGGDPDFRDVIYAGGLFVAGRENGDIVTSSNGAQWTKVFTAPGEVRAFCKDNLGLIAGGQNGMILRSVDGQTWRIVSSGNGPMINAIAWSGTKYVAVGGFGIRVSTDGEQWRSPSGNVPSVSYESCIWTGVEFLAGALSSNLFRSTDGENWTTLAFGKFSNVESLAKYQGRTYACGSSGSLYSSEDLVSWTQEVTAPNLSYPMDLCITGGELHLAGFNGRAFKTGSNPELPQDPPPPLPDPEIPVLQIEQAVKISWQSESGVHYSVQASDNLLDWKIVRYCIDGTGGNREFYSIVSGARRFWRLQPSRSDPPAPGGLVITSAEYGVGGTWVDVISYLQARQQDNRIGMQVSNSSLGGDPVPGQGKTLRVQYTNESGNFTTEAREGAFLQIPNCIDDPQ
jgi:hypothetical protein